MSDAARTGRSARALKTSERVALDIVDDIVTRGLQPGDQLPLEAAMVGHYGVSRASLREGLRLLEVQGLIRLKPGPGGGPVVGRLEAANLGRTACLYLHLGGASYEQLYQAQLLFEPLCASAAAADERRRAVMEPFLVDASHEPVTDGDAATVDDFHAAVYSLTDNLVLRLFTEAVSSIVAKHLVPLREPLKLHDQLVEDHAAIARAIIAGDGDEASQLTEQHFLAQHELLRSKAPETLEGIVEWR